MRLPLTTFASGFFNSRGIGPIGMAVNGAGQVIVNDVENSTNYVFHDVDGQTVGTAITSTPCNAFPAAMRETAPRNVSSAVAMPGARASSIHMPSRLIGDDFHHCSSGNCPM